MAILIKTNIYYVGLFIAISLICFIYSIVVLWKLLDIIIELKKTIDDDKKDMDNKTIELLSALGKKAAEYFLKKVYIKIDDEIIKDGTSKITVSVDKKQELKIRVVNSESRMAKTIEIGFIFPLDFIIEKKEYYSIVTSKTTQIIRYARDLIHGNTNQPFPPLIITPLKEGDYIIRTFIKAENIESTYRNLNLKVTEKQLA